MDEERILLVVPEGSGEFAADVLAKIGHPVMTCHGPAPDAACPLVHGEGCPWYDDAHGIVFALDLAKPAHRAILRDYQLSARREGRDVPIRVVVPEGTEPYEGLFDDVETWTSEPNVAQLDGFAAEVEAADRGR